MYGAVEIEERVDYLESILGQFIVQTNTSLRRLTMEMAAFKDEMKEFKDEMKEFKDEMKEFKDETRNSHKQMNKQWGDLANKMGTLVEDIIAPAVRPVVEKYFNCEVLEFFVNARIKNKKLGLQGEFDVLAVSEEYVFVVETKSRPQKQHLEDFIQNTEKFRQLFPAYATRVLIPIFSSLRFDNDLMERANALQIYLLAFREWEYMDLLNFEAIQSG